MNLKKLKLLGWLKLVLGTILTGAAAWQEAGGKLPHGVAAGVATATAVVTHLDTSQGRAAAEAEQERPAGQ